MSSACLLETVACLFAVSLSSAMYAFVDYKWEQHGFDGPVCRGFFRQTEPAEGLHVLKAGLKTTSPVGQPRVAWA